MAGCQPLFLRQKYPFYVYDLATFFEQLFLLLSYAGMAQGCFVVLLLNNKSVRTSRANVFLSILLLAMSFSILHIMYAGTIFSHFSIAVYPLGDPTFFLIAPLLWFYVNELRGHKVILSFRLILHFIPFIAIIFSSLLVKDLSPAHPLVNYLDAHQRSLSILFWFLLVIQFSGYLYFVHKKWLVYQQVMEQEVSNTEYVNIAWVRFFMSVFLLINFFFLFTLFAQIHLGNLFWLSKTISVIFSLSIFALGYKGILQKEIFHIDREVNLLNTPGPSPGILVRQPDEELINRLLRYMEDRKPYLDPELTLSSLAKDLTLSRSLLSQLINEGMGDNFYNFINKYRVEQVKLFMVDPSMKNFSLLGIALEAGFKSKSTFNLIFKRFTGLTPTEYSKTLSK